MRPSFQHSPAGSEVKSWRTSRRCESGACIEAGQDGAAVVVRDTTDREGPVLAFGTGAWRAFTAALKA